MVRKITGEQISEKIKEKKDRVNSILVEKFGLPMSVKSHYVENGMEHIEGICSVCGSEISIERRQYDYNAYTSNYKCEQCGTIISKSKDMYLLYGFETDIDQRNCQIYMAGNFQAVGKTLIFCVDLTNDRAYKYVIEGNSITETTSSFGKKTHYVIYDIVLDMENPRINFNNQSVSQSTFINRINSYVKIISKKPAKIRKPKYAEAWFEAKDLYAKHLVPQIEDIKKIVKDENDYVLYIKTEREDMINYKNSEYSVICPECGEKIRFKGNEMIHDKKDRIYTVNKKCNCGLDLSKLFIAKNKYYISGNRILDNNCIVITEKNGFYYAIHCSYEIIKGNVELMVDNFAVIDKSNGNTSVVYKTPQNKPSHLEEWLTQENIDSNNFDLDFTIQTFSDKTISNSLSICTRGTVINKAESLKYLPIANIGSIMIIEDVIRAYIVNPLTEQFMKIFPDINSIRNICTSVISNVQRKSNYNGIIPLYTNGNSIEEMTGLSKGNLRLFRNKYYSSNNCRSQDYQRLFVTIQHYEPDIILDSNLIDDCSELVTNNILINRIYKILPNCKIRDVLHYLNYCKDYQCIMGKTNALQLWCDYLENAKRIGIDLNDKKARYPKSLKKEHDIVSYKYSLIAEQEKKKEFLKRSEELQKYSYKGKSLSIRPPRDMEELFEEGRKLSHCVGSYGNKIINGLSNIFFIRWNKEPDVPYYTLEVVDGRITQVYGRFDTPASSKTPELNAFINEWKKKFGFIGFNH